MTEASGRRETEDSGQRPEDSKSQRPDDSGQTTAGPLAGAGLNDNEIRPLWRSFIQDDSGQLLGEQGQYPVPSAERPVPRAQYPEIASRKGAKAPRGKF